MYLLVLVFFFSLEKISSWKQIEETTGESRSLRGKERRIRNTKSGVK